MRGVAPGRYHNCCPVVRQTHLTAVVAVVVYRNRPALERQDYVDLRAVDQLRITAPGYIVVPDCTVVPDYTVAPDCIAGTDYIVDWARAAALLYSVARPLVVQLPWPVWSVLAMHPQ